MGDQAKRLREIVNKVNNDNVLKTSIESLKTNAKVITVTSGKGGVGKTNITVNLAIALSKLGHRVVVIDADLGLANIDVLLGIMPKFSLVDVIKNGNTSSRFSFITFIWYVIFHSVDTAVFPSGVTG